MKCDNLVLKKRSNVLDDPSCDSKGCGNTAFRRWEYWGFECYFLLHYTGDHTVFVPFQHRNAKLHQSQKPFIRSSPFVKEKVHSMHMNIQTNTIVVTFTH